MTPGIEQSAIEALSEALAKRLADARAAAHRLEGFAFEPGQSDPGLTDADDSTADAMRDLALKALSRISDPLNYLMMRHLDGGDASVAALATLTGLTRISTIERVNDLLQVGLVGRSHRGDEVGLSPAGKALVALVEAVAEGER